MYYPNTKRKKSSDVNYGTYKKQKRAIFTITFALGFFAIYSIVGGVVKFQTK